jgi:hypothetical protein
MKAREKKARVEAPIDPVLFAATAPARKPILKDLQDAKEQPDDAIEPREYKTMDEMVAGL